MASTRLSTPHGEMITTMAVQDPIIVLAVMTVVMAMTTVTGLSQTRNIAEGTTTGEADTGTVNDFSTPVANTGRITRSVGRLGVKTIVCGRGEVIIPWVWKTRDSLETVQGTRACAAGMILGLSKNLTLAKGKADERSPTTGK
jgi:hypothetical protein